jgi:hypothetical protein
MFRCIKWRDFGLTYQLSTEKNKSELPIRSWMAIGLSSPYPSLPNFSRFDKPMKIFVIKTSRGAG